MESFSESTPESRFDEWWEAEHPDGTGELDLEPDVDEVLEDDYGDE